MNSLRFGPLNHPQHGPRNRALLAGVVDGIAHYGNAFGVATVGGEVVFDEAYNLNPLVNAFALGIVRADQIFFGKATGGFHGDASGVVEALEVFVEGDHAVAFAGLEGGFRTSSPAQGGGSDRDGCVRCGPEGRAAMAMPP